VGYNSVSDNTGMSLFV